MSQNSILVPADSFVDIKSAIASTLDEVHDFTMTPSSRTYAILTNLNCVLMLLAKAEEADRAVAKPVSTIPATDGLSDMNEVRRQLKNQANRASRIRVRERNEAQKAKKAVQEAKKAASAQLGTQLSILPDLVTHK